MPMSPSTPASMTTTTFDRLSAILQKDYKLAADQLRLDASLEDLGIDSLGVADLLFNIEDEFKISLPPEPVQLLTMGDVAQFIDRLVAVQHRPGDAADDAVQAGQSAAAFSPTP